MSIKSKIEAVIYAAEDPVTLDQISSALRDADLLPALMRRPGDEHEPKLSDDPKAARNEVRARLREIIGELVTDYSSDDRGMELKQVAGGYRIATKAEHHDVVKSFAKALKPPVRLSLPALETLAVVAYKQPVTAPEISEIRGVDSTGVLATLIDRKLITTAGRKQVVGRPILYKTTKEFLLRFGLADVSDLPSMEEFEKMTQSEAQESLFPDAPVADATGFTEPSSAGAAISAEEQAEEEPETSPNEA